MHRGCKTPPDNCRQLTGPPPARQDAWWGAWQPQVAAACAVLVACMHHLQRTVPEGTHVQAELQSQVISWLNGTISHAEASWGLM